MTIDSTTSRARFKGDGIPLFTQVTRTHTDASAIPFAILMFQNGVVSGSIAEYDEFSIMQGYPDLSGGGRNWGTGPLGTWLTA